MLTFTSGIIDVVSYLGLGGIFTANMTGNTIFFAIALGQGNALTASRSVTALLGFIVGAFAAGRYLEPVRDPNPWPRNVTFVLGVELVFLATFSAGWFASSGRPTGALMFALIAVLSVGMGMQSAVGRKLAVPSTSTNVITMALTGLMAELAATGVSGSNVRRWSAAIFALGAGASIAAALFLLARASVPWLACATLALVCLAALRAS